MTLWHASTELHTTATVVAKALYLAARLESGRGLHLGMESAELDTSG
jgi:hypothetical protein